MKAALLILPFCLFITSSAKRSGNPYQFISGKHSIQISIKEDRDAKGNNLHKHTALLKNISTQALTDDDSGSFRTRQMVSGISGNFLSIAINKYFQHHTKICRADVCNDIPSNLFNKGSPGNENIRINYFPLISKIQTAYSDFYTNIIDYNKDASTLLILPKCHAITHQQPISILDLLALNIPGQHFLSEIFVDKSNCIPAIKKTLYPP